MRIFFLLMVLVAVTNAITNVFKPPPPRPPMCNESKNTCYRGYCTLACPNDPKGYCFASRDNKSGVSCRSSSECDPYSCDKQCLGSCRYIWY